MSNYKKHSAYASMALAKQGKAKTHNSGLTRWINEEWQNLTPLTLNDNSFYECGKKSKEQIKKGLPSVCRPSVHISDKTPQLASNFNKKQIKKAIKIKQKGDYINWGKL